MSDGHDPGSPDTDGPNSGSPDPGPRRQLVAVLVLLALLIAGSLWITGTLRGASRVQDCVQAGRTNCAPVDAGR